MNNDIYLAIGLTLVGVIVFRLAFVLVLTGGDFHIMLTIRIGWRALRQAAYAEQAAQLLEPLPPKEEVKEAEKPSAEPLWMLTLLQREGRLLDFLLEDIHDYTNEQIGAAVRDIHLNCHKVLSEHLVLVPVLSQTEGAAVAVPAGFDPSAIRLTGNVTGQPPFHGTVQHHGWRVKELKLVPPATGQDQFVVQPAEVELP